MTWLEEVQAALVALGGEAELQDIYAYIERTTARSLANTWTSAVRNTLECNSADTQSYRSGRNVFRHLGGERSGRWALFHAPEQAKKAVDAKPNLADDRDELQGFRNLAREGNKMSASEESSPSLADFTQEWLRDVQAGDPSNVEIGKRFATKLLAQCKDIDQNQDDLVYCDGSGDGGIDIACLVHGESEETEGETAAPGDTWYLVQSKYGTAFQGSSTLLEESQKIIDTLDGKRPRLSSLAQDLLARLTQFRKRAVEGRDKIVVVFATEEPLSEGQRRTLDDVRNIGRGRLRGVFDVESVSIATIHQRLLAQKPGTLPPRVRISITSKLVDSGSGSDLLVGSTQLFNLYYFLKTYRNMTEDLDQLYEKNVRKFLGKKGKVNNGIQKTLNEDPGNFGLYNNGITIVVKDYRCKDGSVWELDDPYVVNGCQTTKTIWEVFHQRLEAGGTGEDPDLDEWKKKAMPGLIITKIVKVGSDGQDMLRDITTFTNRQNAVPEKDFLALRPDSSTWASEMAEKYGVFLEVQRGAWDSQKSLQKQKPSAKQFTRYANAFDLLKVYGAGWLGEAGTAFGKNAAFAPGGHIFKRIINAEGNEKPFGVEDLYAAFCLSEGAKKFEFGRGAIPTRRQTRFLFFMIALELLRDVHIRDPKQPHSHRDLTRSLIKLFSAEDDSPRNALLDEAIEAVDEYLTGENENSLFKEPNFTDPHAFNQNLNGYLKWEKLGKSETDSQLFRQLLFLHRNAMGRPVRGQLSPREMIKRVIKP